MLRVTAAGLAVAWIALLAAYVFGSTTVGFDPNAASAAAAALVIAAAGFLYAWREPAHIDR